MNKFAKGSIAAAAGIVILLGGAGSLAYWNDSAELADMKVNAGQLKLVPSAATDWSPAITEWVPGDSSSYTTTLTLTAEGDNIYGTVALDPNTIEIPEEFAGDFTVDVEQGTAPATYRTGANAAKAAATSDQLSFADGVFTFKKPGVYEIPVKVTADFEFTNEDQNASQNAPEVDLTDLAFVATQTLKK